MRMILPLIAFSCFVILFSEPERQARGEEQQKKKPKGEYDAPDALMPSAEVLKQIETKTAQLAAKIVELRKEPRTKVSGDLLPDVEIYLRGAQNIVRFKEWYNKASGQWTLSALDEGLKRADHLAKGEAPWTTLEKRNVLRAYRSVIDGTAQPYGVTYPLDYGKDPKRKWRVDVVLHGRNASLTEVAFLNSHNGKKKIDPEQDWVQIDIFGRGNNAYRWAGESDVWQVIDSFFAQEKVANRDLPDRRRMVVRGFSMGGAGTWHLGLHSPHYWSVIGPGAGFTTTHDYAWKGRKELPVYQEKCLHIYDAIDYAENARMVPIVAYSGGDDPQKLAADNIEKRLKNLGIDTMTHLVKPGVGHKFEADYFKKASALWAEKAAKDRPQVPEKEQFVTYTLKFPGGAGVLLTGLDRHYEKAMINVDRTTRTVQIKTENVRSFFVKLPKDFDGIAVDGQPVAFRRNPFGAVFVKVEGKWLSDQPENFALLKNRIERMDKRPGMAGPIDDAFTRAFVCVLGSGETYHPATQKFVDAKLKAFKYDWAKHWRGELPTTGDYAVTPNDIKDKNLILFGDPQSNLTLAQIMDKLPLKWTKDAIEFGGKRYAASEHVPVLIFPNPLNPTRYVVLNTGHTWPSEDYAKTNAMLYPRLGDYAILRMDGSVATAGLFDEFWKVEK